MQILIYLTAICYFGPLFERFRCCYALPISEPSVSISVGEENTYVDQQVAAEIDITLKCTLAQPVWHMPNGTKLAGAILQLPTVHAAESGLYGCESQLTHLRGIKWANVSLQVQHGLDEEDDETLLLSADSQEQNATVAFRPLDSVPVFKQSNKLLQMLKRTEGGMLQLSCLAAGSPVPNIIWSVNGTALDVERCKRCKLKKWTLQLEDLQLTDNGNYECRICNVHGCVAHTTRVLVSSRERKAPFISENKPENVTVALNENAHFECPVVSSGLEPHIVWVRFKPTSRTIDELEALLMVNTQRLEDFGDVVVRLVTSEYEPEVLRLGNVQPEDEGWYTCIAANSVGQAIASAYLRVQAASVQNNTSSADTLEHDGIDGDNDKGDAAVVGLEESLPVFKKHLEVLVHKPSGSSVQLSCPSVANPVPNITWSRNDTEIKRRIGKVVYKKWSIHMEDIITEDSGIYTCTLCNRLGCIRHNFKLSVTDRLRSRPIHSDRYPQNQTVLVNTTAIFECKVVSDLEPLILWLRYKQKNVSIDELEKSVPKRSENVSVDYAKNFIQLPTDPDKTNILILKNVTHDDEGWYTCIAANSLGESMASAYLKVVDKLPKHEVYALIRSHPVWITVAGFVVVLLFLLGSIFIIYVLRKLKHEKLLKHRIETVHQWTKKVIIYKPISAEGNSCDLQLPVVKIEKQRTTFQTSANVDPTQAFNEYEFPLDSNWEIPRNQLDLGSTLGEGAFGRVVMAEASGLPRVAASNNSSTIVAVKMVKEEHTDADMASLVREMEVMKVIGKHINIINLLGCCSQNGPLWVIVEYAPHGNLKDFLKKNHPASTMSGSVSLQRDSTYLDEKPHLTEKHLVSFAFQIARGMEYLASRRCIHRDLAARNVLVSDDYVIKIADFGLARDIQDTDYYRKNTNGRLPIKWMAPESLQEKFYDSQSDVWSYGVLLWEIMTYGEQPYPNIMSAEELYSYLITGQRMEKPPRCSLNIYMLMRQCWHFDASARPTFVELVENLDKILQLANTTANEEYLDLSMPMLETPPSSSDDESEPETFQTTTPMRYQYTYKFN